MKSAIPNKISGKLKLFVIMPVNSLILHESEGFICKAFKSAAIVDYYKLLITPQMEASGSPGG
jgi:hypothetical protein